MIVMGLTGVKCKVQYACLTKTESRNKMTNDTNNKTEMTTEQAIAALKARRLEFCLSAEMRRAEAHAKLDLIIDGLKDGEMATEMIEAIRYLKKMKDMCLTVRQYEKQKIIDRFKRNWCRKSRLDNITV